MKNFLDIYAYNTDEIDDIEKISENTLLQMHSYYKKYDITSSIQVTNVNFIFNIRFNDLKIDIHLYEIHTANISQSFFYAQRFYGLNKCGKWILLDKINKQITIDSFDIIYNNDYVNVYTYETNSFVQSKKIIKNDKLIDQYKYNVITKQKFINKNVFFKTNEPITLNTDILFKNLSYSVYSQFFCYKPLITNYKNNFIPYEKQMPTFLKVFNDICENGIQVPIIFEIIDDKLIPRTSHGRLLSALILKIPKIPCLIYKTVNNKNTFSKTLFYPFF